MILLIAIDYEIGVIRDELILISSSLKCPYCFLEIRRVLHYNKEVNQCPV